MCFKWCISISFTALHILHPSRNAALVLTFHLIVSKNEYSLTLVVVLKSLGLLASGGHSNECNRSRFEPYFAKTLFIDFSFSLVAMVLARPDLSIQ